MVEAIEHEENDSSSAGLLDRIDSNLSIERGPSRAYLLWAALGSILLALASMIRGVESATPLPAKFTLSLAYLILSLLTLAYYRCKLGPKLRYPWL